MTKIHLHARVEAYSDEDIATAHDRLFQQLAAHSKMCSGRTVPVAPKIRGGNLATSCDLNKFLPQGMKGYIIYKFRRDANMHVMSGHDYLSMDIKQDPRLYQDLIEDFIPGLIQAMKPLMVEMGDEKFDEPLWSPEGKCQLGGPKACGCHLHPVFFFSDWWLQEGYKLTREQALAALTPVADQVTVREEGLYVVGVNKLVSFEEALQRALRMEQSLKLARPGWRKFFRELFGRGEVINGCLSGQAAPPLPSSARA